MRPALFLWLGLLCALLLPGCSTAPQAAAPSSTGAGTGTIAFVGVTVVPLDGERALPDHSVLVRDGRITAVGPSSSVAAPGGARVIDGRGKYLIPGLADMHTHVAHKEELLLYLARGVTTVRVMWGSPLILAWRERIKAGQMVGPTIVTSGPIVDGDPPAHDGSFVVRTPEEADQAVALHKKAGYDFIKVYSRLSVAAYQRLVVAAREAGLPVAGHVPRAVGLSGALEARQVSVEHLMGFSDELQSDSSPVRGKFDPQSIDKKIDFIDEGKLPGLAQRLRERGVWSCPTLTVIQDIASAEARERLARPEMKYMQPLYLAMWQPRPDPPPEELASQARSNALNNRIVRALRDAGARLLVGTDTGNPFVVPGYSMHNELELLVGAGLTPLEALRAATRDAAEFLGAAGEFGRIAAGQRADLVLLSGNPLTDVREARTIAGVMARGRWFDEGALTKYLAEVEAFAKEAADPFAEMPGLGAGGKREFAARFEVIWKGARFGVERLFIERGAKDERVLFAQSYDGRYNQRSSLRLVVGAAGDGEALELRTDGSKGRGEAVVRREGGRARVNGTLLSGPAFDGEEAAASGGVVLGAEEFLAGKALVGLKLHDLAMGKEREIKILDLSLGSSGKLSEASFRVVRSPDTTVEFGGAKVPARRYEMVPERGPKNALLLDMDGWPLGFEIEAYGSTVRFNRVE